MNYRKLESAIIYSIATLSPSVSLYAYTDIPISTLAEINNQALVSGHYWISEKLDGIRALWNGKVLLSRKGRIIHAPDWFTKDFPSQPFEGELWAGRGQFQQVQKTVLDMEPDDQSWSKIRFMLFELPDRTLTFKQRYQVMSEMVQAVNLPHLSLIEHNPFDSLDTLMSLLRLTEENGGEGLMLRNVVNEADPIKIKRYKESEGVVVGYKQGEGKYTEQVGALLVELENGNVIAIGSGLTDSDRRNPPKLGQKVTFRFNGYTSNGVPRFARYIRVRQFD